MTTNIMLVVGILFLAATTSLLYRRNKTATGGSFITGMAKIIYGTTGTVAVDGTTYLIKITR